MRGVAIVAGAAACALVLASVAVGKTIRLEGANFDQPDPKASISFKVKTNERGKAKEVRGFAFEGLESSQGFCTYATGGGCREGDEPPTYADRSLPPRMAITDPW
jgi:hypothetical protein